MRLGILDIGTPLAGLSELVEGLRAADVDVILADERPLGDRAVWDEAQRLHRADCDGILLLSPTEVPHPYLLPAQVALYLPGLPFLLAGAQDKGWAETTISLQKLGSVWYASWMVEDALTDKTSVVLRWLRAHERRERQRGIDAAYRLYGKRFVVPEGVPLTVDPYQWLRQFGIVVVQGETQEGDIAVSNGKLYDALTQELLWAISGQEPTTNEAESHDTSETVLTHAFMTLSTTPGKNEWVLGASAALPLDLYTTPARPRTRVPRPPSETETPPPQFFYVFGEHSVAFTAACLALDIRHLDIHGFLNEETV